MKLAASLIAFCVLVLCGCERGIDGAAAPDESAPYHWSGIVFGIPMQAEFYGLSSEDACDLGRRIEETAHAYEKSFSLYHDTSELSRLRSERRLANPSPLFLDVWQRARLLHEQTQGYFMPSIGFVWELLEHGEFSDAELLEAHRESSMDEVILKDGAIVMQQPRAYLSFNAIVQGRFAEAVAERARSLGVQSALLQLGETVAIGQHPEGRAWNLVIEGSGDAAQALDVVAVTDSALAVSAQAKGTLGFDPVAGSILERELVVAVETDAGATVADAFATAFIAAPSSEWQQIFQSLQRLGKSRVLIWANGKKLHDWGSD